tara:strand:- start:291 stop:590 length:300 start_codon:yes stop_codon:yes gene_type:complete
MSKIMEISSMEEMAEAVIEDLPVLTEGLIKAHVSEYTFEGDDGEILVEEEDIEQALEELQKMEIGLLMASLCAKDELECAYDNEKNDFIFWNKKEEEDD